MGDPVQPDGPVLSQEDAKEANLPASGKQRMMRNGETSKLFWEFCFPSLAKLGPEGGSGLN